MTLLIGTFESWFGIPVSECLQQEKNQRLENPEFLMKL